MKPIPFAYQRPASLSEAARLLAQVTGVAKPLGGGQSLGPMLNLRLVRPELLVDVSGIEELRGMAAQPDGFRIGGAITHAEVEDGALDPLLQSSPGLAAMLRYVAGTIAYRAVRNRGTLAGSLAHADPAADWVLAMTALDAHLECTRPGGQRRIAMTAFMSGAFTTALEEGEVLAAVVLPAYSSAMRWGYYKFCRKPGEFAEASCAAVFDSRRGMARVVVGALDGAPALLENLAGEVAARGEAALTEDALRAAVDPVAGDRSASDRQMIATVVKRSVRQAVGAA
ncbi:MAG: FAD binding domain-containing protein [Noviherbaspirillum sp.]